MYDKKVRRRRVVLGLLVACSLILLTASFGDEAGPLRSIQRGVNDVLSPVQEGASRALKPARDLVGWVGDSVSAKGDVEELRAERDALRRELVRQEGALRENERLRRLLELSSALKLEDYRPLAARVITQSPSVWYATVGLNRGSSDGVREGMPVVSGEGLIGRVTDVTRGSAQVTLITDHTSGVSARTNRDGVPGIVVTASTGNRADLVLKDTPARVAVDRGDRVVTAGTRSESERLESLFPPDLPIGAVTRIEEPGSDTQEIHLRPFADLRRLEYVQVLTRSPRGNRP